MSASVTSDRLEGTAGGPLAAVTRYTFTRGASNDGRPCIAIPFTQRGSWDDYGVVERREQEAWLWRFIASLGSSAQSGWPGEFIWPEASERDRVWSALREALRSPALAPPSVTLRREVRVDEARAVSEALTTRFCALLEALYGCDARRFERLSCDITDDEYEPRRNELWRCDDGDLSTHFRVVAKALSSGPGVHGEDVEYALDTGYSDGRSARVSARIDLRTGGTMSVTVAGTLDAEQLAGRWIHGA